MTNDIKRKSTILYGNELRSLLNSDHISYGEIQSTLKSKGIFIGTSEKSTIVPILSSTLLKPEEFIDLIEVSTDRELRPKCKVSSIELKQLPNTATDWVTPAKSADFSSLIEKHEKDGVTKFDKIPRIITDSAEKIRIPYTIIRNDYSADWTQREVKYDAEMTIERKGNTLVLDIATTHSSKETEKINNSIRKEFLKILNDASLVKSTDVMEIKFNSFTNKQRVKFFKKLTGGTKNEISTGDVDNIEITVDETMIGRIPSNTEISWLKTAVKKVRIDGSKMNNIFLISNESYYDFYQMHKMDITYKFNTNFSDGKCKVCFSFSDPNSRSFTDNSDLTFSITSIKPDKKVNTSIKRTLISTINEKLGQLTEACFKDVVK